MSPGAQPSLRFAWWNLNDFAHYDPTRAGEHRWPLERAEYTEKCARVDRALRVLAVAHAPDLFGFGEITRGAAEELRDRVFRGYELCLANPEDETLQVAVFFRTGLNFHPQTPLLGVHVPRTTREMPVLHFTSPGYDIRFVFCHWTAFGTNSGVYRERLAETVSSDSFAFVEATAALGRIGHVVVLGDLNIEPFDPILGTRLLGARDRGRAAARPHHTDRDVRRVRFYNPSWWLLGERHAHNAHGPLPHWAGTYYNSIKRAWHTYDQVLVTGGLLGAAAPYFDEVGFRAGTGALVLEPNEKPERFEWSSGSPRGLSDHLPLIGRIVLSEN
jgi:hypothetical protein